MAVRIVTDSTSDLPPQLAHELGISVVPLSVIFGDEVYREGIDITTTSSTTSWPTGASLPTTSAPSVGDFLEVYERVAQGDRRDRLHPPVVQALRDVQQRLPGGAAPGRKGARIEVIDSRSVSLGMMFAVLAAARAARRGLRRGRDQSGGRAHDPAHPHLHRAGHAGVRAPGRPHRPRRGRSWARCCGSSRIFRSGTARCTLRSGCARRRMAIDRMFQIATSYHNVQEVGVGYSTNPQDAHDLQAPPGAQRCRTRTFR